MTTAQAIKAALISPNVPDGNFEPANVVDVLSKVAQAMQSVSYSITANAAGSHDASGGYITSLTEAVMGVTAGLHAIAGSISELAEAQREAYEQNVDE